MVYRLNKMIVLSLLTSLVTGARILCVFPDPSRSHAITYEPLTRALTARGHQVTVISSFPQGTPLANYTDITLMGGYHGMDRFFNDIYDFRHVSLLKMLLIIREHIIERCNYILSNLQVQRLINAKNEHFDLIILEYLLYECFVGFAHKFKAPFILVNANRGTHWIWDVVGNPSPFAYVPSSTFGFSEHMTFLERVANTLEPTLTNVGRYLLQMPYIDLLMKKYFNDPTIPYVGNIAKNASLFLIASHESLDYPKPSVPALVSIGGIHIKPPNTLPNELQQFLDEAVDGAVYFSLGSTLNARLIPSSLQNTFAQGFSQLGLRVLWSWDGEAMSDLSVNVRVGPWLPQADILAHPNVCVFLTQGGYVSLQESVYNGVPIVGIPIYGDQFWNTRLAQNLGFGIELDLDNVTAKSLKWALKSVCYEKSYREKAREVSVKFRDNLQSPLEKAVYWTEYVIRHKGARHLRVAALDLAWYQYFMLDIAVVVLAAPLVIVGAGSLLMRKMRT